MDTTNNKKNGFFYTKYDPSILPDITKDILEIRGFDKAVYLRLYPKNTPEIIINLADPLKVDLSDKTMPTNGCFIQGSKANFVNVRHPQKCHFLSIRFTPNGFYKLFGIPQKNFTNETYQLQDVSNNAETLVSLLKDADSPKERFHIINKWLQREVAGRKISSHLLSDFIINELSQSPAITVNKLVDKIGYTRKHLVNSFKEQAGCTIKEYQKTERMYKVLKHLEDVAPSSWAKLACDFGFYDQSHFIREFKNHTGYTPTEYTPPVSIQKNDR